FIILAKKTPSSRSVKGHSPVSRWEMNWLRTRDGRKPS
ncbi:aspartate phosphatase, partial [Bacillus thuringiensis]